MSPFAILLIDDNVDHRFLTKRALRRLVNEGRVTIHVAEDGEEGLRQARAPDTPDLVLLDIKMPRKDGFEVLAELRADPTHAHLPIVMLTSSENRVDIERARQLGANDYMTKPLDPTEFQQRVLSLVTAWLDKT